MILTIELMLFAFAVLVLWPMAVLAIECLAALCPRRPTRLVNCERPPCAVLVPAHDEEAGLSHTLCDLRAELRHNDRLVVIADNCADRTAEVARGFGAEVIERHDVERRGKGYALDLGVRYLAINPPAVVVVVDADCRVAPGSIDLLARAVAASGQAVQAADLLDPPPHAGSLARLSAFAFRFKNLVRPLGLQRLGLPCLLNGTGMAFPWHVLRAAPLASGHVTEDMHLSVELALRAMAARFEPGAQIRGNLPESAAAAVEQRRRWEHGHLHTLLTQVPRLLWAAAWQRRLSPLALAAELSVPPLTVLALLWCVALAAAGTAWWLGSSPVPAVVLASAALLCGVAALLVWWKFGREVLPPQMLLAVPLYIAWKVPIALSFVGRRQTRWVRTARSRPMASTAEEVP